MARYFLTGATGFIGGRLAVELRGAGHEVVTVARSPQRAGELQAIGVEIRQGDITRAETLLEPMRGADGVFHLAGWYKLGTHDAAQGYAINVAGTCNVLATMAELGIARGVYTSTLAVFSDTGGYLPDESYRYTGRHLTEYDRTKWLAHYEVAERFVAAGLPLITVMPGVVYGPGDTSLIHDTWEQYLRRRLPAVPAGTSYAWGYVDDIAHAHLLAMEDYIIAGPVHTLEYALLAAERLTGIPAPRFRMPRTLMRAAAAAVGPVDHLLPLPSTFSAEALRSSAGVSYIGSNEKAKRELGYHPRSLTEGLPPTLAWEMERLNMPLPPSLRA